MQCDLKFFCCFFLSYFHKFQCTTRVSDGFAAHAFRTKDFSTLFFAHSGIVMVSQWQDTKMEDLLLTLAYTKLSEDLVFTLMNFTCQGFTYRGLIVLTILPIKIILEL